MAVSRTKRTIQNSRISLLLFLVQIFVGFYSRKIFLDNLGDEVIGLNTTLGNILGFLNLAELGIGLAMATSLYKPIHNNDQNTIIEIISVQGFLYRRIALTLCGLSIPVFIALPFVFPSTSCGILYIYVAYLIFLSGSIFSYLWNYRQVLIEADQKSFKLMPWIHGVRYTKIFTQIALLTLCPFGIWGWIGAELLGNVATVFVINHVIRKEYPWLRNSKSNTHQLLHKYTNLLTKTKQLFVHKIGGFVLTQTSPLIIYAFVSLQMVTFYGNYMMLIGYCTSLLNVVFGGMTASIGNLVADNNKCHTMDVFWELFSSRIWIGGIACFGIYIAIGPFISLWIGNKYVLEESSLLLMVLYMFIHISRSVIESFKDAYQLFGDVWAPIAEACLNLGGSIVFGYFWGLNGVLIGINLSLILIILLWKPYYIFHNGMQSSVLPYYFLYIYHLAVLIAGACIAKFVMRQIPCEGNYIILTVLDIFVGLTVFTLVTYIILQISTKGMRMFTIRVKKIITHKI